MKIAPVLFVFFLMLTTSWSQEQKKEVFLVEEKQKKRTILYVQNDSDQEKSIFLKVNPTGYRRSAQRPILKIIPSKSKIQMVILIPLPDTEAHYTYDLIVNDKTQSIDAKRN